MQYDRSNGLMLESLSQNDTAWHSTLPVLVTSTQLHNDFWPLIYHIGQGWGIRGRSSVWGLEAEDVGEDGLGVFARLEGEEVYAASEEVEEVLLDDGGDELGDLFGANLGFYASNVRSSEDVRGRVG